MPGFFKENKVHPAKKILQEHGISLSVAGRELGVSYWHICRILSGAIPASPAIELKLKNIINKLENSDKRN